MATFGGTFVDNSKKCHATAFEKATGSTVKYVLGSSVQTMAKLRAAGARAEFDVAYMDSQIVKQAKAEGLLQAARAREDRALERSLRRLAGQGRATGCP